MIKRKKRSISYKLHQAVVRKLSARQLFWLYVLALLILGIVGILAPSTLIGLL